MKPSYLLLPVLGALAAAKTASAELPISGRPVPALSGIDDAIEEFMEHPSRQISAGVVGVSSGGKTVYLRSFGWLQKPAHGVAGIPLPETALFRIASVSKSITAAAIHELNTDGALGAAGLNRRAFNLVGNGGVLNVTPFGQLGDADFSLITISHLLGHAGGFRRDNEPYGMLRTVANDLGVSSPPQISEIMRWRLGKPLTDTPGQFWLLNPPFDNNVNPPRAINVYGNFDFTVLGEIVEQVASGGYLSWLSQRVLSPEHWIPANTWAAGRAFRADAHPLEPVYASTPEGATAENVFDNTQPYEAVPAPYGPFSPERGLHHGGLVVSASAMLAFGERYKAGYESPVAIAPNPPIPTRIDSIGLRFDPVTNPLGNNQHSGGFQGTTAILAQRRMRDSTTADDLVIFIAFNKTTPEGETGWDGIALNLVLASILGTPEAEMPTERCDGFWVNLGGSDPAAGYGGYDSPYQTFAGSLQKTGPGSRLRLKPGTSAWRGMLDERMELDAPEGLVTIGAQP